jgi:hypothetical protein
MLLFSPNTLVFSTSKNLKIYIYIYIYIKQYCHLCYMVVKHDLLHFKGGMQDKGI